MKLPDYSEFMESLTPDDFAEIERAYNSSEIEFKPMAFSYGLLHLYHNWLSEQLDKEQ